MLLVRLVPELLLELGLVVLDILAKLFDLLRVALLPPGNEVYAQDRRHSGMFAKVAEITKTTLVQCCEMSMWLYLSEVCSWSY